MRTLLSKLEGRRIGLVLSAGYFGFYGHAGFVDALLLAGVRVAAWAGTSAGGLVAAFSAAGVTAAQVAALLTAQRREHFWDPDWLGIAVDSVRRGHRPSGLLQGRRFRALLEGALPVAHFEDLPSPLVLVATDLSSQRPAVLTRGPLASAVHATCAYPGLFQAVRRDGALLWDGGIVDKAPALALAESPAGRGLDALLVHYLPSRDGAREPSGPLAWPAGLASGFAAVRRDHFRLQLAVLEARGVPVYVVESALPPVTPRTMARGLTALEAGRRAAQQALAHPPRPWSGEA